MLHIVSAGAWLGIDVLRYWWVAVKLVLTILLCTLIVVALQPGMADVAAYGRALPSGTADPDALSELVFPPAVSLTVLSVAIVLSIYKPWGRVRASGSRQ